MAQVVGSLYPRWNMDGVSGPWLQSGLPYQLRASESKPKGEISVYPCFYIFAFQVNAFKKIKTSVFKEAE